MSVNNCLKILSYVYPITKEVIRYNSYTWNPVNAIYLRNSLFAKDECAICSKCCIHEDLIFLPFEVDNMKSVIMQRNIDESIHKVNGKGYDNISELLQALKPITVEVNDKQFELFKCGLAPTEYHFDDRGDLKRCHFDLPTEDGRLGCGIHTVSSLTCKMPHIRFYHNSKTLSTSIGHGEYGRNWALKCPANIAKEGFCIDSLRTAISNFELLKKYCEYFEIDTYVGEILENLYKVCEANVVSICDRNIVIKNRPRRLI